MKKKTLRKLSLRRETLSVLDLGRATGAAPQPLEDTGPGTCCCTPPPETDVVDTYCCLTPPGGGGGGGGFGGGGGNDEVVTF